MEVEVLWVVFHLPFHALPHASRSYHTVSRLRLWEALEAGAIPVLVEEFGPGEEQER